jgi:biotin synthase
MKTEPIQTTVDKALAGVTINKREIRALFSIPLFSRESYVLQWASRTMSARASNGLAEVHAQVGINISACPKNCRFCSFARRNKVFHEKRELAADDIIERCRQFESDGANAIYLMSTANFPFERFLELSALVRKRLQATTVMVANTRDLSLRQALMLKRAGYAGIYHALRLGEGRDTLIKPERRIKTFHAAQEAGLLIGTCVEPVGSEHSVDELVEKTIITRQVHPVYSGAARRIAIPGSRLAASGMVSEARMAHILASVRMALGYATPGNCTHEPNALGALAGANLFWAEAGSNPRDRYDKTENGRGLTVQKCRRVLEDAGWDVLCGPSKMFSPSHDHQA